MRVLFFSLSPLPRKPFWLYVLSIFILQGIIILLHNADLVGIIHSDFVHWAIFASSFFTLLGIIRRLRDVTPEVRLGLVVVFFAIVALSAYLDPKLSMVGGPLFLILLGSWPSAGPRTMKE